MDKYIVSTKIDFKSQINIADSQKHINYITENINKLVDFSTEEPQVTQLPMSSNQPGDIPIMFASSSNRQLALSKSFMVVTFRCDEASCNVVAEACRQLNGLLDNLDDPFSRSDIASISSSMAVFSETNSLEDIKKFMSNTNFKEHSFTELGFNLDLFSTIEGVRATGKGVQYATSADIESKKSGIQTVLTILLGGLSFETSDRILITDKEIEAYQKSFTKKNLDRLVDSVYGMAS